MCALYLKRSAWGSGAGGQKWTVGSRLDGSSMKLGGGTYQAAHLGTDYAGSDLPSLLRVESGLLGPCQWPCFLSPAIPVLNKYSTSTPYEGLSLFITVTVKYWTGFHGMALSFQCPQPP